MGRGRPETGTGLSQSHRPRGARGRWGGGVSGQASGQCSFYVRAPSAARGRVRDNTHVRGPCPVARSLSLGAPRVRCPLPPPRVACATLPSPTPRPRHRPQYTLYTAVSTFRSSIYSGFQSILRSSPFTTLSRLCLSGRLGAARLRSANLPSLSPPRIPFFRVGGQVMTCGCPSAHCHIWRLICSRDSATFSGKRASASLSRSLSQTRLYSTQSAEPHSGIIQ